MDGEPLDFVAARERRLERKIAAWELLAQLRSDLIGAPAEERWARAQHLGDEPDWSATGEPTWHHFDSIEHLIDFTNGTADMQPEKSKSFPKVSSKFVEPKITGRPRTRKTKPKRKTDWVPGDTAWYLVGPNVRGASMTRVTVGRWNRKHTRVRVSGPGLSNVSVKPTQLHAQLS